MTPPKRPRGGPRPGFGGKQPKAGRKAQPVTDEPVTVSLVLGPELAKKLDALRGEMKRTVYLRTLLEGLTVAPAASGPDRPVGED